MKSLIKILYLLIFIIKTFGVQNLSHKTANDIIDYYQNYDYELTNNLTVDSDKKQNIDTFILPNPEIQNVHSKYTVDVLPDVQLPSDSLADTDLKDHDFIDNLMYIYYGSKTKNITSVGSGIIIVGAILSCAAQLLTIFCALLRKKQHGAKDINKIFLHLILCLTLANLVFILGVYSTKNCLKCHLIAYFLHYLHLLTAFWIFLHCYYIYKKVTADEIPSFPFYFLIAYGAPLLPVMMSFIISPSSYETKLFCFVSVQKGMLLNYMLPVSALIITTTVFALNGIRKINLELSKLELTSSESLNALRPEDIENQEKKIDPVNSHASYQDEQVTKLREYKSVLKILSLVQTSFDVVWFIAVLALENASFSNVMPIMYLIAACSLNWYIFFKLKIFIPSRKMMEKIDHSFNEFLNEKFNEKVLQNGSRCSSSDNIPLLNSSDGCTELIELRMDTISTITS